MAAGLLAYRSNYSVRPMNRRTRGNPSPALCF